MKSVLSVYKLLNKWHSIHHKTYFANKHLSTIRVIIIIKTPIYSKSISNYVMSAKH